MPSPPNITNITPPRVPLVDERTGLIAREWYRFFLNLFNLTGAGNNTASLKDLQLGPPVIAQESLTDVIVNIESLEKQPTQESALEQIAELQKQIQGVQTALSLQSLTEQIAEMQTQIQGLQVTPPRQEFKRARYGSFYDTTTQVATTIGTATAVTFNTTNLSNGVYIGSPTSRIYVDTPGIYNFALSFQIDKTSGGTANFYIWVRLNGVNVANSAGLIQIQGNNAEIFSAYNLFLNLNANDYVEIMFSVTDVDIELLAVPATAPVPAIPSIILTVNNNIEGAL